MTIGERIRKLRLEKGLSQVELAAKLNTTKQSIHKYEKEIITNIPSDKISKLADIFEVSPSYLMGWENSLPGGNSAQVTQRFPAPNITDEYATFPVIGSIAAGYDKIAVEDWGGETVDIPNAYLRGRSREDYLVLRVDGDSMYPLYQEGDIVLILKQPSLERSGDIGAIIYDNEYATIKKIEYVIGEDWLRLVPLNPTFKPELIEGARLEQCQVIGVPKLLIRNID